MNELTMLEGVADSGIKELSLDEIEMISGGSNTRGAPRRPAGGGGGRWGWVFVAAEFVWDRWGGPIIEAVDNYISERANPTWSYEQQYRSF